MLPSLCLPYTYVITPGGISQIMYIIHVIFKPVMDALRVTPQMTEIVFFKALQWLPLSKCAMNQLTIKCIEFMFLSVLCNLTQPHNAALV